MTPRWEVLAILAYFYFQSRTGYSTLGHAGASNNGGKRGRERRDMLAWHAKNHWNFSTREEITSSQVVRFSFKARANIYSQRFGRKR